VTELTPVRVLDHPGGWKIVPVHYSMDPSKDVDWVWKTKARGKDTDWEKEYEINFASVVGKRCFESFSLMANTKTDLKCDDHLPIRLTCDFNVDPMCWLVCQINNDVLYVLDEVYLSPGSVVEACDAFLDRYGDHYGEVFIYGDASGKARSQRDQRSNYDEMRLRFSNRPFRVRMKVPTRNPSNVNSVMALNRRLQDEWGNPRAFIARAECENLIADLTQVVWDELSEGKRIKKVRNPDDPYFYRTHASDALMALVYREWPTKKELVDSTDTGKSLKHKRKRKKRLLAMFPD
jgi:hypothetical protein